MAWSRDLENRTYYNNVTGVVIPEEKVYAYYKSYNEFKRKYGEYKEKEEKVLKPGDKVMHKNSGTEYTVWLPPNSWCCPDHKTWVLRDGVSEGYAVVTKNLELVEDKGEDEMTKLYEVKDETKSKGVTFATKLATNSAGEWVMEEKGTGRVFSIDKASCEEVLPYSIRVKFGDSGTAYSYLADKDQFEVGFYLVAGYNSSGFQVARVTEVDTKSKVATKHFKPFGKISVDLLD